MSDLPATIVPDIGGVFATDAHRRVLAHLRAPKDDGDGACEPGAPMSLSQVGGWEKTLVERLLQDAPFIEQLGSSTFESVISVVKQVIADLVKDGYAKQADMKGGSDGYAMTDKGFDALNGPNGYDPPAMTLERVEAMHRDGLVDDDGLKAHKDFLKGQHA